MVKGAFSYNHEGSIVSIMQDVPSLVSRGSLYECHFFYRMAKIHFGEKIELIWPYRSLQKNPRTRICVRNARGSNNGSQRSKNTWIQMDYSKRNCWSISKYTKSSFRGCKTITGWKKFGQRCIFLQTWVVGQLCQWCNMCLL